MKESYVTVNGREVKITNLDKLIWPEGLTKAHLIKYYTEIAPYILPHLYNRPIVMNRYPDGIEGESFYQKECPDYAPEWIEKFPVAHSEKVVNYILCNNMETLVWLSNQVTIEMHPWLSKTDSLDHPDLCCLDLDPNHPAGFEEARHVAMILREILDRLQLRGYPKTSGATGIHIFFNTGGRYTYGEVRQTLGYIAEMAVRLAPERCTTQRKVADRGNKVYIDYLQNVEGKTIASVYSVRPLPGAPVSMPVTWEELQQPRLSPTSFHIGNALGRLKENGDLFGEVLRDEQSFDQIIQLAGVKGG